MYNIKYKTFREKKLKFCDRNSEERENYIEIEIIFRFIPIFQSRYKDSV